MALLQISEPGQSPNPHERRVVVGIDLGTTHSLVAAVRHGVSECLPDEQGRVILPSVVRYLPPDTDGAGAARRLIGWQALDNQLQDPGNTIVSVKRLMGRLRSDVVQVAQLPYTVLDRPGMATVATAAGEKTPIEISAEILATLRYRAEDTFNDDLFGAVITVPAYFDDAQRQATKDAAEMAGIHVMRLINEPTAAAIAYGLDNASEGTYAVFDLGGGTFDVSILKLTQGVFEVVATGGDSALGGDDYDRALLDWLMSQAGYSDWLAQASALDRATLQRAAKRLKEQLSSVDAADTPVTEDVQIAQGAVHLRVTPAEFATATQALTARTLVAVRKALRDAGLSKADIQGVVMVGGSTRMPAVREAVQAFFGQPLLTNLNPDEVVALGAAIQANQLAGNNPNGELLLLDVIPLSLGIETMGGLVERIVPRNTTIPAALAQDFTTYRDGQTALALHVVQGERDLVADCRSLARFELRGIPPMAAGAARIRVTFTIDADGLLSVTAREQGTGVEAHIDVKPAYGLSDEQIAKMLQDSFTTAQADMQARALVEARVDADRMLLATQTALVADGDLLTAPELADIQALMQTLRQVATASQSAADIEASTQALAKGTEAFAAQRMNRGISRALAGRHIEAM